VIVPPYPSVDVVVPTRNRPELLRQALDAILGQDYPGPVTVRVVFDQSPPDAAFAVEGPDRRVVVHANDRTAGLAGARNTGILACTGEFVAFCDDDDVWLPRKLGAQIAAAGPDDELVTCGIRVRYADRLVDRPLAATRLTLADLLRSRLTELHPSTFVFRRAALVGGIGLVGIGLVDEEIPGGYAEDYEFLLRTARRAPIRNLPDVLVEVRWHRRSYFSSRWDTISTALQWLLDRYPEFHGERRGRARVTGQIAFARAAAGQRRDAVRWAGRTLRRNVREPRAYLALAVATGAVSADVVLRLLHTRGRGI
jgi:glycosyltransferase involved in cell wall biosynthesis